MTIIAVVSPTCGRHAPRNAASLRGGEMAYAQDQLIGGRECAGTHSLGGERRLIWLALLGLTVIAAALRVPFLSHQSLWFDETYTRSVVAETSLSGLWHHIEATESTPPLYYLLTWLIQAHSAAALRLIPALALTAAVPCGYFAFVRLIGERAALASAAMLAVNPMLVSYSTDARSYGLFVLIAVLSVWAFSALLEAPSTRRFLLWTIAAVACLWTHYFGVFLIAAEIVVLFLARPEKRKAICLFSALSALCVAPLIPMLTSQSDNERAGFIAAMPLGKRLLEAVRQLAMGANVPRTWLEGAGLAIFCLALAGGVILALRRKQGRARALLAVAAIAFLAPLLLSALKIEDRFYARNMIATLPLAIALAAPAMLRLKAAPLAIYLALATLTSIWVATNWRYQQTDWRSALAQVEKVEPSAPIVAVNYLSTPVISVYLSRAPATAPVLARRAWIVVEPVRGAGHRFLGPAPAPTLPGFSTLRSFMLQGFQLILVQANAPTGISPGEVAGASLYAGAR